MKLSLFLRKMLRCFATLLVLVAIATFLLFSVYPRYGRIVAIEYDYEDLFIEDAAGLVWVVDGWTDLSVGDGVAMLMWNRFSPNNIFDDVVLDYR